MGKGSQVSRRALKYSGKSQKKTSVHACKLSSFPYNQPRLVRDEVLLPDSDLDGGRSSVGRAPDCDSGGRGFEPLRPPQIKRLSWRCSWPEEYSVLRAS